MGELARRVGGVSMTRDSTHGVEYVDAVTAVEATAMRSTRRVGDLGWRGHHRVRQNLRGTVQ
jgi:hypothetical protein